MNKNYLTQVVILFLLTIGILLGLSTLKPTDISFTTKEIDVLSSLREAPSNEEMTGDEREGQATAIPAKDSTAVTGEEILPGVENAATVADSIAHKADGVPTTIPDSTFTRIDVSSVPRKAGDITLIEDYTTAQAGLRNLKAAIGTRQRPVRIAVLGDSFTEADIMTQNIRQLLQDEYGGCGVGYMPMYSDCPGFRHSVSHVCKGWETHSVISKPEYKYTSLMLQMHRPQDSIKTSSRFKGVSKLRHLDHWNVSKIGFIAENGGVISVKTDSGSHSYDVNPDTKAQFIVIPETTQSLEIKCDRHDIAFWGAWLDGHKGIAVDNISVRGYSGTTIPSIPVERMRQLNEAIPYDIIVLQYGLNSMNKNVTDYAYYTVHLVKMVNHLRAAFPSTDIVIMGISDRCQNINGTIQTMKAVYALREAQRKAAIETGCHFWDCCEAMKTLGGMAAFVDKKWANKDYTHISRSGGAQVAEEFVKALKYALGQEEEEAAKPEMENEKTGQEILPAETQNATVINE